MNSEAGSETGHQRQDPQREPEQDPLSQVQQHPRLVLRYLVGIGTDEKASRIGGQSLQARRSFHQHIYSGWFITGDWIVKILQVLCHYSSLGGSDRLR